MKTFCVFAAALVFLAGCGSGGGGSVSVAATEPNAEKATDVWEGVADASRGSEHPTTCIVTPWAEIRCFNDEGQVLFGTGTYDGNGVFSSAVTLADSFEYGAEGDHDPTAKEDAPAQKPGSGLGQLVCAHTPHKFLDCELMSDADTGAFSSGRLALLHKDRGPMTHACLITELVRADAVTGFWVPKDGIGPAFSIDKLNRLFGQDPETGCIFTGEVKLYRYDPDDPLALHEVQLVIEACLDSAYQQFNGRKLNGIAYLDTTRLTHDTLFMAVTVRGSDRYAAIGKGYRRQ